MGSNRREMLLAVGPILDQLDTDKRKNIEGQIGFFDFGGEVDADNYDMPRAEEFPQAELLAMEKEVTGMYLSGHPMAPYAEVYRRELVARMDEIALSAAGESEKYADEQYVDVLAIVADVKKKATKSGANMAFVTLEDIYGSMEALVFPKVLERCEDLLQSGGAVKVHGRISFTEEKDPKLLVEYMTAPFSPEEMLAQGGQRPAAQTQPRRGSVPQQPLKERPQVQIKGYNTAYRGLYLRVPSLDHPLCKKALQYVEIFDGITDLYLYSLSERKLVRAPAKYRVAVNYELVSALKRLLGEENVALKDS